MLEWCCCVVRVFPEIIEIRLFSTSCFRSRKHVEPGEAQIVPAYYVFIRKIYTMLCCIRHYAHIFSFAFLDRLL